MVADLVARRVSNQRASEQERERAERESREREREQRERESARADAWVDGRVDGLNGWIQRKNSSKRQSDPINE